MLDAAPPTSTRLYETEKMRSFSPDSGSWSSRTLTLVSSEKRTANSRCSRRPRIVLDLDRLGLVTRLVLGRAHRDVVIEIGEIHQRHVVLALDHEEATLAARRASAGRVAQVCGRPPLRVEADRDRIHDRPQI